MATTHLSCYVCQFTVFCRQSRHFYSSKRYMSHSITAIFRRKTPQCTNYRLMLRRAYSGGESAGAGKGSSNGGFFKNFVENLRKSLEKNKEIHENLKAFEDERSRVVKSDSVKLIRQKVSDTKDFIVTYTLKAIDATRSGRAKGQESLSSAYGKVLESDVGKKGQVVGEQVSKSAQEAAKKISEKAKVIGETDVYQTVSKGAEVVKEDLLDDILKESGPYKPPEEMLKRSERASITPNTGSQEAKIEADDVTQTLVTTRQSKWKNKWNKLRENNPISNMFYSAKMKYDESDNLLVRASRSVTDKVEDAFDGVVTHSDMAEALGEIYKIDPRFDKELFVKECQFEIIPTVLEAYLQGKIDILKDWCHEGAFNVLSALIKQRTDQTMEYKVLEVRDVDIIGAKVLEMGPVMVLTFNAQQLTRKGENNTLEEVMENVFYVWALCRDQSIYDPKMAWRVMEFGIQASGKLLV